MASNTATDAAATSDLSAEQSYKNLVDDYTKQGLGLSKGAKIGIGVGASIVGLVVVGMIILLLRLRRSKSAREKDEGFSEVPDNQSAEARAAEARRMKALDNM
ncbi:hypothetical protein TWF694_003868 [Orbilia ellipsospora]|uniref:Uncharacterized protein n=1 Tax=Orbilia ellipsospora TaxID=2528407 RepID=A0AAV9X1S0_9PEZI